MKFALLVVALAVFSACKRSTEEAAVSVPTMEVVAGAAMIDFTSDEAKFTCRLPGEWEVREEKYLKRSLGVSLSGPDRAHIAIFKYPEMEEGRYKEARAYAESFDLILAKRPEITEEKMGAGTILRFHYELMPMPKRSRNDPPNRIDVALFPVPGGFYEIKHSAPADSYRKTLPVFEAVVRSFKPKP